MIVLYFLVALCLSTIVAGAAVITNSNFDVQIGVPFTITWTGATSMISLALVSGPADDLTSALSIATGITGTSYTWTPPSSIPTGTYSFLIDAGGFINYSAQFQITGEAGGGGGGGATVVQSASAAPSAQPATIVIQQSASAAPSAQPSTVVIQQSTSAAASAQPSTVVIQQSTSTAAKVQSSTSVSVSSSPPSLTQTSSVSTTSPKTTTSPSASSPRLTTSSTNSLSQTANAPTTSSLLPDTTSSTATPASPTSTVQSNPGGLSTGAQAGIGIGAALGAIIIVFVVWLVFRQRRKQREERIRRDAENGGADSQEKGTELITSANTHEMEGKPAVDAQVMEVKSPVSTKGEELDSRHISPISPKGISIDRNAEKGVEELEASKLASELGSPDEAIIGKTLPQEMQTQSNTHEMATATNFGSDWEHFYPSELDSKAIDQPLTELSASAAASKPQYSETATELSTSPVVTSSTGSGPDQLETLQMRMEQVRADKERLERIQQLKDLEASLQQDIMAEQKRRQDTASGS